MSKWPALACMVLALLWPPAVMAEADAAFPSRPLRLIVPIAPGSSGDTLTRSFAEALRAQSGRATVVENRPGADLVIGTQHVVASPADGYTLLLVSNSSLVINPVFLKDLPYKADDLLPLIELTRSPAVLVTGNGSRLQSFAEWLDAARWPTSLDPTPFTGAFPMTSPLCKDRVVVITGAGRGLGREYALEFARQGAKVVVNDLGARPDGSGAAAGPANEVVAEIRALGGEALANGDDVSDWAGAEALVRSAIDHFGALDTLVNNAGILRDKTLVNMSIEDFDAVIRVHLRGTFAPLRHAAAYWRDEAKAGRPRAARVVNTSSSSGLYGIVGQTNYGAAKAGIANLSIVAARELDRYGVTVNAIYPTAMSRLTEDLFKSGQLNPNAGAASTGFDPLDAANVAPLVVWLGSAQSAGISGRVFGAKGGRITVAEGWRAGPHIEKAGRWRVDELGAVMPGLVARAAPNADLSGSIAAKA